MVIQSGLAHLKGALYAQLNRARFRRGENHKKLVLLRNERKILYVDTPEHANLGDHAIALATRMFIERMFDKERIVEITHLHFRADWRNLKRFVGQDDLIILHGGGFIGTLWPTQEWVFEQVLRMFQNNKVICFPQTVFFGKDAMGGRALAHLDRALRRQADICLFARDHASFVFMMRHFPNTGAQKYLCCPDIALTLPPFGSAAPRKGVLFCMRADKESVDHRGAIAGIRTYLESQDIPYARMDTVIRHAVTPTTRGAALDRLLGEFARYALIITDRLHGMILSALTATPCAVFDNISGKVCQGAAWLSYLGYIRMYPPDASPDDFIAEMLALNPCTFTAEPLLPAYAPLKQAVADWVERGDVKRELQK